MKLTNFGAILILLFLVTSCNPDGSVSINTSGIFAPPLYSINNEDADGKTLDYGEHVLTDDPKEITVQVYNDTKFPYSEINLKISAEGDLVPAIDFAPSAEGEFKFPGLGGTCKKILPPGETCLIKLLFSPRDERQYLETLTLEFNNYVRPETHIAKISMLAGMPASLTFTNEITQYTFGDLVGQAQIPVAERQDQVTYTQELEVINAGGLSAKNLTITQLQTCTSTLSNSCPTGAENAFVMESSCPQRLFPKEKCKVKIQFSPKNFDSPNSPPIPEFKEVNYKDTITYDYIKDPHNGKSALNAYFRSLSTNIEARFRTSISAMSFDDPIISGNREVRSFRISNNGYREGQIKSLNFTDSAGMLVSNCVGQNNSALLRCNNASGIQLPLSGFPYTIKDRNNCLSSASEAPNYIPVGGGCVFDLIFQPSVTFLSDKNTEFLNWRPQVVFDARWRGQELINTTNLFLLSAKSKAAARLVFDRLSYDGVTRPASGNSPWEINLGRLTLQSARFYRPKTLVITFKNVGSVEATNLSITDGSGRIIPIGGKGVDLGASAPNFIFYRSTIASDTSCSVVPPGGSCSITSSFAPIGLGSSFAHIGLGTNEAEDLNMFDLTDQLNEKYKAFRVRYNTSSLFTDENLEAPQDYPLLNVETRIKAQLIRKGMLMQITDDTRNVNNIGAGINVAGDTAISHLYLQNIGTGPVSYFRLIQPPSPFYTLITTDDPKSLDADYDCLAIGDEIPSTMSPRPLPTTRTGFSQLPMDESCVYSFRVSIPITAKNLNATSCVGGVPAPTPLEEGTRFFSREATPLNLWEFCTNTLTGAIWNGLQFQYYDGDATVPGGLLGFGNLFSLASYTYRTNFINTAKIIPHSFEPWLGATLYRPGFTYPALSVSKPQTIVNDTWFYGPGQNFYYLYNDPLVTSPLVKGSRSRDFVPSLNAFGSRGNYDYVLYLGSFPQNSGTLDIPISLRNFGKAAAKITNFNLLPDPAFSYTAAKMPVIPKTVSASADLSPFTVNLSTLSPGEKLLDLSYTYEDGVHLTDLLYKHNNVPPTSPQNLASSGKRTVNQRILIVANIMETGTFPFLTMGSQNIEVVQNYLAPPTENPETNLLQTTSWNTTAATSTQVFDTLKITANPTSNDVYAKKRFTFTNSTAFPINDLKIVFRQSVSGSITKTVPPTFTFINETGSCVSGMVLASGRTCTLLVRYQPRTADTSETFVMSMIYEALPGRYLIQNTNIYLLPKSPGQVLASGIGTETINYKAAPGGSTTPRTSYALNFGSGSSTNLNFNNNLDVIPKVISFNKMTGGLSRVRLVNNNATKASLLLSYHRYLAANNIGVYSPSFLPPTSVIPNASEYRVVDGLSYVRILRTSYADNTDKLVIEATKGCLFGDDENIASIPHFQKGFNNLTSNPCYIILTLNANYQFLLKDIKPTDGDLMRETASELWYYSVNRSSTASLWIHLKGMFYPDTSIASGTYSNVQTAEERITSFNTPTFTPRNSGVGALVGIRVLLSTSSNGLNNPYAQINTYVDIKPYDPTLIPRALFNATHSLSNSKFFYYRAVAIRKDTRFVDSTPKLFVGLGAGEYLSAAQELSIPLKVLVPPLGHAYFPDQKLLVEKTLYQGINYYNYPTASANCTTRAGVVLSDPGNVTYKYTLINRTAWNLLLNSPGANSYSNMTQIPHWLSDAPVSIDLMCSALPGFLAGQQTQKLESSQVFYIRNSGQMNNPVNQAVGGIPTTIDNNYNSYVDGSITFAGSRCMVKLP